MITIIPKLVYKQPVPVIHPDHFFVTCALLPNGRMCVRSFQAERFTSPHWQWYQTVGPPSALRPHIPQSESLSYRDMDPFLVICLLILGVSLLILLTCIFLFKCLIGLLECIDNCIFHHTEARLQAKHPSHSPGPLLPERRAPLLNGLFVCEKLPASALPVTPSSLLPGGWIPPAPHLPELV